MKKLLVIAGESSGDIHGANLVREIKRLSPDVEIFAAGGDRIKDAGAVLLVDLVKHAVIGAVEVLKHYHEFKKIFDMLLMFVEEKKPDAVVLIDYPGFNLKFAKAAKERGVKVIYYVSPQIWAWAPGRIHHIKKCVDHMIVILPFEKEIYEKAGIPVDYVGHPILDVMEEDVADGGFKAKFGIKEGDVIVGLLPGSRENEVRKILPVMLDAAAILKKNNAKLRFFISCAGGKLEEMIRSIARKSGIEFDISSDMYNIIKNSRACMVASGTVTVQTAFYLTPMVIIYKVAFITALLGRIVIRIPYIGMVNVIAGRKVIDEFIQYDARPARIARKMEEILGSENVYKKIRDELKAVKEKLGSPGASARAAKVVLSCMEK